MLVCFTWVTSVGYSASTRAVTSHTAPPISTKASSSVHQVARSGPSPARRRRAVSGCSSALSKIAAANGTMTTYSRAATLPATHSSAASSSSRHAHPALTRSQRGDVDGGGRVRVAARPGHAGHDARGDRRAVAGPPLRPREPRCRPPGPTCRLWRP